MTIRGVNDTTNLQWLAKCLAPSKHSRHKLIEERWKLNQPSVTDYHPSSPKGHNDLPFSLLPFH